MKTRYITLIGTAALGAFTYFVAVPNISNYLHLREMAKLERTATQADLKVQIALKEAAAKHDAYCSAEAVKPISVTRSDTDGGTKQNAKAIATLVADEGYFIYAPSLKRTRNGTRNYKNSSYSTQSHERSKGTAFSQTILYKAQYTVRAYKKRWHGNGSVTATATLSGVQISEACLEYVIDKEKSVIMANS